MKPTIVSRAVILLTILWLAMLAIACSSDVGTRNVMGLGTAQRNISAALVVAGQNEV